MRAELSDMYPLAVDNQHQVRVPRVRHVRITSPPPSPPPVTPPHLAMIPAGPNLSSRSTTPTGYFPEERDFPPIGPGHEGISMELDDKLTKAIGMFAISAFSRLDPDQGEKEEDGTRSPDKGKQREK